MITIIKCQENDLDLLNEIAIQSYNDTYQYLWTDGGTAYLKRFYNKPLFAKELTDAAIFYFLIYEDEKPVGFFKLIEAAIEPYTESECLELDKLYLLKEHTGKGIAKIVMNFVFDFAKEKQRSVLWLLVMDCSPAKFVYEKLGFTQIKQSDLNFPTIREEYKSILTMMCTL